MSNNITVLGARARLNEVVGTAKTVKEETHKGLTAAYHQLQKASLFTGFQRTYTPLVEGSEQLPPEAQVVQADALRILDDISSLLAREIDHEARREHANCVASADIVIGDTVLATAVPATLLLQLEKQLRALKAELDKLPVLDPAQVWTWDAAAERWTSGVELVNRTKKEPRVITKVVQDEHHAGQAEVVYEDRAVGQYAKVNFSRAVSARLDRPALGAYPLPRRPHRAVRGAAWVVL